MASYLIILNGPPYGNECAYNSLRLAGSLIRKNGIQCHTLFPCCLS